jgi:hypothetical protein
LAQRVNVGRVHGCIVQSISAKLYITARLSAVTSAGRRPNLEIEEELVRHAPRAGGEFRRYFFMVSKRDEGEETGSGAVLNSNCTTTKKRILLISHCRL